MLTPRLGYAVVTNNADVSWFYPTKMYFLLTLHAQYRLSGVSAYPDYSGTQTDRDFMSLCASMVAITTERACYEINTGFQNHHLGVKYTTSAHMSWAKQVT